MIVFCENCGKKYQIDGSKVGPKGARFKCKVCDHFFTVAGPSPSPPREEAASSAAATTAPSTPAAAEDTAGGTSFTGGAKSRMFGLRTKMILLFFFIPMVLIAAAGVMYIRQVNTLAELINNESESMVSEFSEQIIAEKSRAVALQVKLFLDGHPMLDKKSFNTHVEFKQVAVQKVGMTGYTTIYEIPGSDGGTWKTWAHPNPEMVDVDMQKTLANELGPRFKGFWNIFTGVKDGGESSGYYMWRDASGKIREKYMVCTPVPGTDFVVSTNTYLDEFERHAQRFKARSAKLTAGIKNIVYIILGVTLLLVALAVSVYGQRLTGKITRLTDLAERISVGELDASVEIKSNDEIGDLGEAISRMQTSIRYSIERLRRR